MRSLLFTSMWNQLSYHCLKNYCKFQMINVPVVSVCKVLCATMERLTAIAAITGWRGLVKSLLSHPIISIFFVHSLSLVLALRILSRRIFPLVLCQKKKKKVILEVIEIRSPWKFAIGGGPNINTSLDVDTNLLTRVCVHPGLLLRGDFLSSI